MFNVTLLEDEYKKLGKEKRNKIRKIEKTEWQ